MALQPMARFDVIPYQRITSSFKVGVVAFTKPGIEKVAFSFNGGAVINVTNMTLNDRVGVWEYWTTLNPASYANGEVVTIDATVTGNDGGARALPQISVVADNSGTYRVVKAWVDTAGDDSTGIASAAETGTNPFATIGRAADEIQIYRNAQGWGNNADGGVIYLNEGDHTWASPTTRYRIVLQDEWLTITRDISASKALTRITVLAFGLGVDRVKVSGITADKSNNGINELFGGNTLANIAWIWFNDLDGRGYSPIADQSILAGGKIDNAYYTECTLTDLWRPTAKGKIARNITIQNCGSDAFRNCPLIINGDVDNASPGGTGEHTDLVQFFNNATDPTLDYNVIVFNVKGTNLGYQGVFWRGDDVDPGGTDGAAFVNVYAEGKNTTQESGFVFRRSMAQLLLWNCVSTGGKNADGSSNDFVVAIYSDSGGLAGLISQSEVNVIGCSFNMVARFSGGVNYTDWWDNHYKFGINTRNSWVTPGTNFTLGDPMLDATGHPQTGSPLLERIAVMSINSDYDGNDRTPPSSLGIYRGPSEGGINSVTQQNTGVVSAVSLDTVVAAIVDVNVGVLAAGVITVVALDVIIKEDVDIRINVPILSLVSVTAFDPGSFWRARLAIASVVGLPTTVTTGVKIFSGIPKFGDFGQWTPAISTRWSIQSDGGSDRLLINTSDYAALSGQRLGEIAVVNSNIYGNFSAHFTVKTQESLGANTYADFAFVFGYVDSNNYKYFIVNADQVSNELYDVIVGSRGAAIGTAGTAGIVDEAYHGFAATREGTTLTITRDGAAFFSITNAAVAGRGQVGIGGYNDSSIWDDIKFTSVTPISPAIMQMSV